MLLHCPIPERESGGEQIFQLVTLFVMQLLFLQFQQIVLQELVHLSVLLKLSNISLPLTLETNKLAYFLKYGLRVFIFVQLFCQFSEPVIRIEASLSWKFRLAPSICLLAFKTSFLLLLNENLNFGDDLLSVSLALERRLAHFADTLYQKYGELLWLFFVVLSQILRILLFLLDHLLVLPVSRR